MRGRTFLIALASLASCSSPTPEITQGLPSEFSEAEPIFDARVKQRFPVGMSVDQVERELEEQGFVLAEPREGIGSADFRRSALIMTTLWSVRWRASNGQIEEIWGVHGAIAP